METTKKLAGESPLSFAEKEEIIQKEYAPKAHRLGLIISLIHIAIFFLPPLYIMFYFNVPVDWAAVGKGTIAVLGFSAPFWFIEPISYFLVLGIAGTYISVVSHKRLELFFSYGAVVMCSPAESFPKFVYSRQVSP